VARAEPSLNGAADSGGSARGITFAAGLLAGSVLLSRVLGLVRDMVLGLRVGAGSTADAYNAAFQLPDLLNHFLVGGALSIAFVPLWTSTRARDGEAAADRLFATVLGSLGLAVGLATLGLFLFTDELVALQFPLFTPEQQALTARLTRIVLPGQMFFVVGGVIQAVLMAKGRFVTQAAAPLVYNLAIIAGGLLLAPLLGVEGFAWGALVGAVVGPFVLPLLDARGRTPLRPRVAPFDPDFSGYLAVAMPLILGVTLLTVDEWYSRWFGQLAGVGTIAVLAYGRRLMLVPVAVVGQALATAALPTLSRLWAEGRREELDALVLRTLKAGIGVGMLGGAALFALSEPVVRLVYERGAFSSADTLRVAAALEIYALAVPAWIAQQIAVRPFYARGDTWRPMLLGTFLAVAAVPLYIGLAPRGALGLAAAGVLAVSASAAATLILARRFHGAPSLGSLGFALLRAAGAAVFAALVARWVLPGHPGTLGALLDLAVGGTAFLVAASAAIALAADAATREAWLGLLTGALRRLRAPR
jgi:putative peptidoglycan lipid II flippase